MTKNYQHILKVCRQNSTFTGTVIDNFLIHYAARTSKLAKESKRRLQPFRHIIKDMPKEWRGMLTSQYIAHRIFKKGGLIRKYLNHSGLNVLSAKEKAFLGAQTKHPWRYSFASITDQPAPDFFEMRDILTEDRYLLYSPSITSILLSETPLLWFNLIGFNGECWQTYGPILHFNGFEPEDIFFYANEANGDWYETGEEVMEDLEEKPIAFSMLIAGSNSPLTFHNEHQLVNNNALYKIDGAFNSELFRKNFLVEYNQGVYKLSLKEGGEFPHYSAAFYDEMDRMMYLFAMTDSGFRQLLDVLNHLGYTFSHTPDERVNVGMIATASNILKKEIKLNPYDHLFAKDSQPVEQPNLDQMNGLLGELIPYINNRETPDLDTLSAKYGVNPEKVKELYEMVKKKVE
ncbi:MAG: hypothetical protein FH748_08725 [Balneolaceae bacterium]|nr:hypothetical protein [Balneolaceae bacterium]